MIDPPQPGRLSRGRETNFGFLTPRQNMEVVQNHSFRNSSIHGCRCRECKSFFAQTRCVKPGVAYLQAEAEFDMHLLIGRLLRHCGLWTLSAWLLPGRIQLLGFQTPVSINWICLLMQQFTYIVYHIIMQMIYGSNTLIYIQF